MGLSSASSPRLRVPWGGVQEQGWIWTAGRAEQILIPGISPGKAVSALEPSPRRFSSITCRGCSREDTQCTPKRIANAEGIRTSQNVQLDAQLPLGEEQRTRCHL